MELKLGKVNPWNFLERAIAHLEDGPWHEDTEHAVTHLEFAQHRIRPRECDIHDITCDCVTYELFEYPYVAAS